MIDRRRRLRLGLGVFFVALALPAALLVAKAASQLRWEAFHLYQQQAVELAGRIDRRFAELVRTEESRAAGDYGFLVVAGDPSANFLQLSPLAAWPPARTLPGTIGWFQVDPEGVLSTPLVPADDNAAAARYGIGDGELAERRALQARIEQILGQNRLLARRSALPEPPTSAEYKAKSDRTATVVAMAAPPPAGDGDAALADTVEKPVITEQEIAEQAMPRAGADIEASGAAAGAVASSALSGAKKQRADAGGGAGERDSVANAAPQAQSFDDAAARQRKQSYLGPVDKLNLEQRFPGKEALQKDEIVERQEAARANSAPRIARKQREALAETVPLQAADEPPLPAAPAASAPANAPEPVRIRIFDTEIEPLGMRLLESGQFVLYRHVWREGRRFAQGVLVERDALLDEVIAAARRESLLAGVSDLAVAWQGEVLSVFPATATRSRFASSSAADLQGSLLYRSRLAAPLDSLELVFSLQQLPAGPGASVIWWLAAVLAVVLCGGTLLLYRLALGQITVAEQQQDFVAAVSHELKTPLTSIRMYGEMLREGWAAEEKKPGYYAFIHDEAERLSRLIGNVLQLARISRNEAVIQPELVGAAELLERVRPKLAGPVERAGFTLELRVDEAAQDAKLRIDPDAFCQVLINLVDNALKFAAKSEPRRIELECRVQGGGAGPRPDLRSSAVQFTVRDFGPGIPDAQMKKIFRLFYRIGNELTRETAGTGIGLALVKQLVEAMGGSVDVMNRQPGAEFRLRFPRSE